MGRANHLTAGSHAGTHVASELPENLTFVAPDQVSRKHAIPSAVRLSGFASWVADDPVNASLIREILLRPPLPYDFRYGRPSLADFPHATRDRTLARRARRRSIGDLDYGAPEGAEPLREELRVYPVSPLYSRPPKRAGLLLGYTSLTEKEIAEGIRRLASVLASMND
jgi:DNA-binding transcriptional MocR family regulator